MNLLYGKEYVEIDFNDSKVIVTFTTNNGQSKKFEDEQLQALSEENPAQALQELALQIEINKLMISRYLYAMRKIQKKGKWLLHLYFDRKWPLPIKHFI